MAINLRQVRLAEEAYEWVRQGAHDWRMTRADFLTTVVDLARSHPLELRAMLETQRQAGKASRP